MNRRKFYCVVAALVLMTVVPVLGQTQRPATEEGRTLELVDRLKDVIRGAERNRNADPWLLDQLRDLVRRYDWPWRVRVLSDDFGDGDYTANPTWVVGRGEFWVTRGAGLRSSVGARVSAQREEPQKKGETSAIDILGGILKGITEQGSGPSQPAPSTSAEIYTGLRLSNAFAIKVRMMSRERSGESLRIEFGPYQGKERDWGYRLAYNGGRKPSFELLRVAPGRSAVVEIFEGPVNLEDGRIHDLEWRRDREGNMVVALDGREIIRTLDRGATDFFDGFTVINGGGDYSFDRIEIFGTER